MYKNSIYISKSKYSSKILFGDIKNIIIKMLPNLYRSKVDRFTLLTFYFFCSCFRIGVMESEERRGSTWKPSIGRSELQHFGVVVV